MADPELVDDVLDWLEAEWKVTNYPGTFVGSVPAFVDGDNAESTEFQGRRVKHDLEDNNAVIVSSSPNRQQEPAGQKFAYRFDDGVSIRIVAAHADVVDFGSGVGVTGKTEFKAFYQEVRRILHGHRTYPNISDAAQTGLDLRLEDETNLSPQYKDLYEYDITAIVRGREEL